MSDEFSKYKSNSNMSRSRSKNYDDIRKPEKVVSGSVKTVPKKKIKKLFSSVISDDTEMSDMMVPIIKKAIYDIVSSGCDKVSDIIVSGTSLLLYGEPDHRSRHRDRDHTSYSSCYRYQDDRGRDDRRNTRVRGSGYDFDDIIFDNRGDAEVVLSAMEDDLARYKVVSVLDLYDHAGLTADYTSRNYGWINLDGASVSFTRDGYILKLPKAMPLDD